MYKIIIYVDAFKRDDAVNWLSVNKLILLWDLI